MEFKKTLKNLVKAFIEVLEGASQEHRYKELMRREAGRAEDLFLLLCFGDFIGIPSPSPYFTFKLLPYVAQELPKLLSKAELKDATQMLSEWESYI
jgi:hypothetical protein